MKHIKPFNESTEIPDWLTSEWMYQNSIEEKRAMFVHDTYEYLTGYFGTLNSNIKEKGVKNALVQIFDDRMNIKEYKGNPIGKIERIFGDNNVMVSDIIDLVWNGE